MRKKKTTKSEVPSVLVINEHTVQQVVFSPGILLIFRYWEYVMICPYTDLGFIFLWAYHFQFYFIVSHVSCVSLAYFTSCLCLVSHFSDCPPCSNVWGQCPVTPCVFLYMFCLFLLPEFELWTLFFFICQLAHQPTDIVSLLIWLNMIYCTPALSQVWLGIFSCFFFWYWG